MTQDASDPTSAVAATSGRDDRAKVIGLGEGQGTSLLDRLQNEAKTLAEDARHILADQPTEASPDHVAGLRRLEATAEMGRITTRIALAMSWILARKAVVHGELAAEEARQRQWRLERPQVIEPVAIGEEQPEALGQLSARSVRLFDRIDRLDRQLDIMASAEDARERDPCPTATPVH